MVGTFIDKNIPFIIIFLHICLKIGQKCYQDVVKNVV